MQFRDFSLRPYHPSAVAFDDPSNDVHDPLHATPTNNDVPVDVPIRYEVYYLFNKKFFTLL
jgi:hypothetical protein